MKLTQNNVLDWVRRAFGEHCASDLEERGSRLLEEAIEAAQACDVERDKAHLLVDHIYSRPAGELWQEIGGTMITIHALAECAELDHRACADIEWKRICELPQDYWDRKHTEKHAAGIAAPVQTEQ